MSDLYILDGKEAVECSDIAEWSKWCEENSKTVEYTKLDNNVSVSTVFLGMNHAYGKDDPPLIYETMIFGGEHDEHQARYNNWHEAERGHIEAIRLVLFGSKNT